MLNSKHLSLVTKLVTKLNLLLPESTVQYYGAPNWVKCNKGVRGSNLSSPSVLMRVGMYYKISYYKPIRVESIDTTK